MKLTKNEKIDKYYNNEYEKDILDIFSIEPYSDLDRKEKSLLFLLKIK